ncbi:EF-hand domain-containing protein [Sulfurospirillum deleyianum]|uniref:EF hand-containing protein n=1 Tax=Sulfurospirillum deleyianum (strain ATCC 51133 / DSM 6946 / 5175) TaxID=525898 RepID=D1B4X4_SULD5|nr:EF-hand domain-containing protein [Sulfurospirillum deleyianum]ACZ13144.1 EF hand-containing protein [Sulfurospirillum deleyianum DSM 6946]
MTVGSSSLYETYLSYGSTTSSSRSSSSDFAEALLTSMDSDSSGSVDSAEFSSAALALSISDESAISSAFSSLDSDGDGTISQEELSASLSESSNMVAGSMPPPPPPPSSSESEDTGYTQEELTAMAEDVGSSDSNLASLLASVVENFDAADSDGDGKVTAAEAMAYQQSTSESTENAEASNVASSGMMPPPPPPPSSSESEEEDTGYTIDELTAMAETAASTDSNLASLLESVIENFDEADANEDGKVSSAEAQAYKESTKAESIGTEDVASSSSEEESLMSALLAQIVSRYSTQTSLSGSSFNLSA